MKMQKIKKWLISTALCLTMTGGLATPAMAADLREQQTVEADAAVADADETGEVETTDETGDTVEVEESTDVDGSTDADESTDEEQTTDTGTSSTSINEEAAQEALQETAKKESTSGKYIKELRVSKQKTEEAAKAELEAAGYKVIDQNLNEGASGDDANVVYLGYKTTDDVSEAVRDIATMNLSDAYKITDYETVMLKQYQAYAPIEKNYAAILKEYRENIDAASPYAMASYDMLNMYCEDDTNQKLGEYLRTVDLTVSDGTTISELAEFVTGISNNAHSTVISLLGYSLNSYKGENFLQKMSEMSEDEMKDLAADRGLENSAARLEEIMELYAESLTEAKEKIDAYDAKGETIDDEELASQREMIEALDSLPYEDGTLLDFFMNEDKDSEKLVPLVGILSEGQIAIMEMVGPEVMLEWELKNLSADSERELGTLNTEIEQFKSDFINRYNKTKEDNNLKTNADGTLSVYYGVDRSIMEGTIAMTDAASAYMLSATKSPYETAGEVSALLAVGSFFVNFAIMRYIADILENTNVKKIHIASAIVSFAAIVVFLVLTAVFLYMSDEQYAISKIPDVIIDKRTDATGTPYFVRYYAVNSFETYKDEPVPGDLNGGNIKKGKIKHTWDVLYTSKEIDAGEPIQAKYKAITSVDQLSDGDWAVHRFASEAAHNFNEYTNRKNLYPVYLSFKRGVAVSAAGSFFASTSGQVVILIFGILLGAALVAVLQAFSRRRKKVVA